jgi:hypothetical protein
MNNSKALLLATLVCLLPLSALANNGGERVQVGQDIVIEEDEAVSEAVCIGCSIRIRGSVAHEAVAVGGNIDVEGSVGHEVVAVAGSIRLGPGASVGHDVVSVFGQIDRDPTASVGGEIVPAATLPVGGLVGIVLFFFFVAVVIHLVLVILCYLIAGERRVETVARAVRERAGLSLLTGIGVLVGAVILYFLSAYMGPVTPILALLVSLALFVLLIVGYTGLSYCLGRSLARTSAPLVAVLLGAVLITLLQCVPALGLVVFLVFFLLALGSAAVSGLGSAPAWLPQQFAGSAAGSPPPPPAPPAAG